MYQPEVISRTRQKLSHVPARSYLTYQPEVISRTSQKLSYVPARSYLMYQPEAQDFHVCDIFCLSLFTGFGLS